VRPEAHGNGFGEAESCESGCGCEGVSQAAFILEYIDRKWLEERWQSELKRFFGTEVHPLHLCVRRKKRPPVDLCNRGPVSGPLPQRYSLRYLPTEVATLRMASVGLRPAMLLNETLKSFTPTQNRLSVSVITRRECLSGKSRLGTWVENHSACVGAGLGGSI